MFNQNLTKSYLKNILQKKFKNTSIEVENVKVEPCGALNDGFLSTLLRVCVDFVMNSSSQREYFIVKLATSNDFTLEKVGTNGFDVQNKEMLFFEVIAPQIEKILAKVDKDKHVIPKAVAVDRDLEVIIFEDLRESGFYMPDKKIGLNKEQTEISLRKLAKFHAASLIIHQKFSKAFESFDVGIFNRKIDAFNDAFISIYDLVVEEVELWPGFEKYAKKMRKIQDDIIEAATRCFDDNPNDFCVLNHGDLWKNNIMFSDDESNGMLKDAVLIDFQFCHWASPALDLHHFFYTSLHDDFYYQDKIETFVQFYYYELKDILKKFDYDMSKVPILHSFMIQFDSKMFYGMMFSLVVFPIMFSDDPDNDFKAHHSRDERATNFKRRMLKNPYYQKIVRRMLPVFDHKGLLDIKV